MALYKPPGIADINTLQSEVWMSAAGYNNGLWYELVGAGEVTYTQEVRSAEVSQAFSRKKARVNDRGIAPKVYDIPILLQGTPVFQMLQAADTQGYDVTVQEREVGSSVGLFDCKASAGDLIATTETAPASNDSRIGIPARKGGLMNLGIFTDSDKARFERLVRSGALGVGHVLRVDRSDADSGDYEITYVELDDADVTVVNVYLGVLNNPAALVMTKAAVDSATLEVKNPTSTVSYVGNVASFSSSSGGVSGNATKSGQVQMQPQHDLGNAIWSF